MSSRSRTEGGQPAWQCYTDSPLSRKRTQPERQLKGKRTQEHTQLVSGGVLHVSSGKWRTPWEVDEAENLDPNTGLHSRSAGKFRNTLQDHQVNGTLATPNGTGKGGFQTPQSGLASREPLSDISPLFQRNEGVIFFRNTPDSNSVANPDGAPHSKATACTECGVLPLPAGYATARAAAKSSTVSEKGEPNSATARRSNSSLRSNKLGTVTKTLRSMR